MNTETETNRYANDWNSYSAEWERRYGRQYQHLGDEWCDDGTAERAWEQRLFANTFAPWLAPDSRVVEIGPGGGKWTVRLAPRVQSLVCFDVAEAMLDRTRARVAQEGLTNVSFVLGNGLDMSAIESNSVDVVFSYDVFVHIALEDTVAYVAEIARILKDGGIVLLHHAVNDVRQAWDRIESHNDWYRGHRNTLGQYYYHSREALMQLYERYGLQVRSTSTDYCMTIVTARKPSESVVPRLEQALRQAAAATDEQTLEDATRTIAALGRDLAERLALLTPALRTTLPGHERHQMVQQIRTLVRG
jgi:ubiquinone/menaquinone biosynthesis C-methylase UbiE